MSKPTISIIVAISNQTRAIGKKNELLWKIPNDLKRFKELTTGHPIIMGRKTFESIGRPLPNRTNVIITRNKDYTFENCSVVGSLDEAIELAKKIDKEEIFIIGGGEIYKQALPFTDRLYLTVVDDEPKADTFFPDYSDFKKEIFKEEHPEHTPPFIYLTLER
jgi:dihydrofolate reductase